MKILEDRIRRDGQILPGNVLKVDSFLNHQIDVSLISQCAEEWYKLFKDDGVTKIMTIEASGIGIACIVAEYFKVPVLFAKKSKTSNIGDQYYSTVVTSYTHGRTYDVIASKKFINPGDRILLIDDFLANGSTLKALTDLVEMGGATVVGCGVAIEKAYQGGGDFIRSLGYRVESLASISSMSEDGTIEFK